MTDFGTNVDPKLFGRGSETATEASKDWECVCGATNRGYLVKCLMCNVTKKLAKEANGK